MIATHRSLFFYLRCELCGWGWVGRDLLCKKVCPWVRGTAYLIIRSYAGGDCKPEGRDVGALPQFSKKQDWKWAEIS